MKKTKDTYHVPVMLNECIEGLNINPSGVYVDVTFGGGGHSKAIAELLNSDGKLYSFDQDPDAKNNTWDSPNFEFIQANFSYFFNHLRLHGVKQVDGILADLGVSSHQFDETSRGFSIHGDAKLDMRMNQNGELTAESVVNDSSEEDLINLFRKYGEIPNAKKLASAICLNRTGKRIRTTAQLLSIIEQCAPKHREHKYYAQVFQAIRIHVNDEMSVLESFLEQCVLALKPEGRLVIMSYHSLEDRLVKNFMKKGSFDGKIEKDFYGNVLKPFNEVTRKPITPQEEEIERNSRARSAKLRIASRNGQ